MYEKIHPTRKEKTRWDGFFLAKSPEKKRGFISAAML